jgi:hypothetical protein
LQDSIELAEAPRRTKVGFSKHDRLGGDVDVSPTIPVKPLTLLTVTIELPEDPASTVTSCGLEVMLKSTTLKATTTE